MATFDKHLLHTVGTMALAALLGGCAADDMPASSGMADLNDGFTPVSMNSIRQHSQAVHIFFPGNR